MNKTTGKHLTTDERVTIQTLLDKGVLPVDIAKDLQKSPSTVTREIQKHTVIIPERSKCASFSSCRLSGVCKNYMCTLSCKRCEFHDCTKMCSVFQPVTCAKLQKSPHLCNGCTRIKSCVHEQRLYNALTADKQYKQGLIDKRSGFDLTEEELKVINEKVTPLIKAGHSPYAIAKELGDELCVSESSLYRILGAAKLEARDMDLPEKVKRKARKHPRRINKDHNAKPSKAKEGRLWPDYLEYIKENRICPQMDCVEGRRNDEATLLTLHFPIEHMQLYFIMDRQISAEVVRTLDKIERAIGTDMFNEVFPAILTDNGQEFTDIEGMERSCLDSNRKRTHIYFCEPNRSDEKGAAERNHRLLRRILPKDTDKIKSPMSFEALTQADATLITNHVNSYVRPTLGGICPYDLAMETYDEDFFILLGLEKIPYQKVVLKPDLVMHFSK